MSELYKFWCKKSIRILLLLLVIPLLFGVGYFFDLSYMIEDGEMADNVLAYCAQMQLLIKNIYFLAVIFISCDVFSGEIENGQIRISMVHMYSRKISFSLWCDNNVSLLFLGSKCFDILFVYAKNKYADFDM